LLALKFLPSGIIGLVVASLFTNTLSMTSSDANTISAVITRDILPTLWSGYDKFSGKKILMFARISTFSFTVLTIIIALNASKFGGVLGLIISWFAALLGPIAIPMILGLMPAFRKCGSKSAIISIVGGLISFIILKFLPGVSLALTIGLPLVVSLVLYIGTGLIFGREPKERLMLFFASIKSDTEA